MININYKNLWKKIINLKEYLKPDYSSEEPPYDSGDDDDDDINEIDEAEEDERIEKSS